MSATPTHPGSTNAGPVSGISACDVPESLPRPIAPPYFPSFADLAHDLVRYRRAAGDAEISTMLDNIRFAFDDLIDRVSIDMPDGPDAHHAARKVHDACQAVIFAVVRAHVP